MQKTNRLVIEALKSPIITSKGNLLEAIKRSLKNHSLREGDVLVITSKVVALTQGKLHKIASPKEFERLVRKEADQVLGGKEVTLTIKNDIFIPWAGIDRSNIPKGFAVLWPKDPYKVASQLQKSLLKHYKLKHLGIIISDSCCTPLRRGVSAVVLGYAGFKGVKDLRGKKDLYGNPLKVTQQAVADNLAVAAHLIMGESDESTPFALIRNASVVFTNQKTDPKSLTIAPEDCLFAPLYL